VCNYQLMLCFCSGRTTASTIGVFLLLLASVRAYDPIGTASARTGYQGILSGVVAGDVNTASGDQSCVVAGYLNTAFGHSSGVVAGNNNDASGDSSGVVAGQNNDASGDFSGVVAGFSNKASGDQSCVVAGWANTASGINSGVVAGESNTASGKRSLVLGGNSGLAQHYNSVVFPLVNGICISTSDSSMKVCGDVHIDGELQLNGLSVTEQLNKLARQTEELQERCKAEEDAVGDSVMPFLYALMGVCVLLIICVGILFMLVLRLSAKQHAPLLLNM